MNVDPEIIVIAVAIMAAASCVQGSIGFGCGLLAIPLFALLDPDLVPGPIFVGNTVLTISTVLRERNEIVWSAVGWGTAGRLPGTVIGSLVLARATDTSLQALVAIIILFAVALSIGPIKVPINTATLLGAGGFSGFSSTSVGFGGPPMALVIQRLSGPQFRSTMGMYFVVGLFMVVPGMALAGRFGLDELRVGAFLVPGALAGFAASGPLRKHVDARSLAPFVLFGATAAAVALLVRVLNQWT
ncbi:MAG: sulfite exporter TauE/SafE family protein [Acidimicrobiia bacterium]|nr:sulfite exporter TauE/SafE family protein [Acidimicrobiia bacterium]MCY4458225.1 sulfite exporter TauE/SafE family protein [Acidimicrobiaceae bacterium]